MSTAPAKARRKKLEGRTIAEVREAFHAPPTPTPEQNLEISRDVVYRLAELTGVKLADEWKACRGERLLRFLEMHTMEQLTDLAKEWGEGVYTSKKQALVEDLRQSHSSGPRALPAVLKAAVPAAKKPKPR